MTAICSAQISWNYDEVSKYTWSRNCDFYGDDLISKLTEEKDCSSTCRNTPGCTHFTWAHHDGRCYMKQGSPSQDKANLVYMSCGIMEKEGKL